MFYFGGKFDYSQFKGYIFNFEMEDIFVKLFKDEISEFIGEMMFFEWVEFDRLFKYVLKR